PGLHLRVVPDARGLGPEHLFGLLFHRVGIAQPVKQVFARVAHGRPPPGGCGAPGAIDCVVTLRSAAASRVMNACVSCGRLPRSHAAMSRSCCSSWSHMRWHWISPLWWAAANSEV